MKFEAEMSSAESSGNCCATLTQFIVNAPDIGSLVIRGCRDMTHAWHLSQTTHLHYTDCSFWHLPTLKHSYESQSLAVSLQLKPRFAHTIISAADQRPFTGSCRRQRRPCVCLTEPRSVKQWLNLCKQALALLPNFLPAVWAGACRGLIPWHGHGSHMLMCTCSCWRPKLQDEDETWRQIHQAPTNNLQRLFCLTSSLHTKTWLLLRDDG